MSWFKKASKALSWLVNPVANVIDQFQKTKDNSHFDKSQGKIVYNATNSDLSPGKKFFKDLSNFTNSFALPAIDSSIEKVWNDVTGQTAIDKEFQANKDLAKYQSDMQEEFYNKYSSPEALMAQYTAAGLNPNLVYGSASSGQSNVPSYSAPAAAHQLSYTDKLNKALSIISSVQGVKNLIYQTVANREAAEQAAIRTHNQFELMRQNRIKTAVLGNTVGWLGESIQPFFRNSSLGRRKTSVYSNDPLPGLTQYSNALRSEVLNRAYGSYMNNSFMNGSAFNLDSTLLFSGSEGRNYWLNYGTKYQALGRKFDYDWNQDYKTMLKGAGVASPIIQTLLRLLGGK